MPMRIDWRGRGRAALTLVPRLALGTFALALLAGWLVFPTYPNYDSTYALLWAGELLDGRAPSFDGYRTPTQHPLLLPVGVALAPLGPEVGARGFVGLCFASLVLLVAAVYRLGRVAGGAACGFVAAALIASRLNLSLLASIGFLDIPYCALVAWAGALEAERPRRGGRIWVLLGLAGLLRPEGWLLAGLYALWIGWGRDWRGRCAALACAAVAPALWAALDWAVTGDPLFSIRHTDALAVELARDKPLSELPRLILVLLTEIVKWPVLAGGAAGLALAVVLRRWELAVPGVMVLATCATYLVIASGGLATVYRYLLVAALGVADFAGFALTGWTALSRGRPRTVWALVAGVALLGGAVFTLTHTSPAKVRQELHERERLREDLRAALEAPPVASALRCGPVTVPTHKLIPEVRALLGAPAAAVRARSDRSRPPARTGVALTIATAIERRPALNVFEVDGEATPAVLDAPPGFERLAATPRFTAWGRCAT